MPGVRVDAVVSSASAAVVSLSAREAGELTVPKSDAGASAFFVSESFNSA